MISFAIFEAKSFVICLATGLFVAIFVTIAMFCKGVCKGKTWLPGPVRNNRLKTSSKLTLGVHIIIAGVLVTILLSAALDYANTHNQVVVVAHPVEETELPFPTISFYFYNSSTQSDGFIRNKIFYLVYATQCDNRTNPVHSVYMNNVTWLYRANLNHTLCKKDEEFRLDLSFPDQSPTSLADMEDVVMVVGVSYLTEVEDIYHSLVLRGFQLNPVMNRKTAQISLTGDYSTKTDLNDNTQTTVVPSLLANTFRDPLKPGSDSMPTVVVTFRIPNFVYFAYKEQPAMNILAFFAEIGGYWGFAKVLYLFLMTLVFGVGQWHSARGGSTSNLAQLLNAASDNRSGTQTDDRLKE